MVVGRRLRLAAAVVAAVAVVVLVGLWLGVPAAVRWGVETVAARELGRTTHLAEVRFNPFTWRLQAQGLAIDGAAGEQQRLLELAVLDARIAASSIIRLAPVVKSIRLQGLRIHLARTAPDRLSISDIIERIAARPAAPDGESRSAEPARFAVYNIELRDGEVTLEDRVVGQTHRATDIALGIPFVSSLPDDVEINVEPAFAATINGAPFRLQGETLPFQESRATSLALRFTGLDLPRYFAYSPVPLGFTVASGTLDTDLRVTFRAASAGTANAPPAPSRLLLSGTASIERFAAVPKDMQQPLLQWQRLDVDVGEIGLLQRRGALKSITLQAPVFNLARREDGSFAGLANLVPAASTDKTREPEAPADKAEGFAFDVTQIRIADGRVDFADATVGFERRLQPIDVTVDAFSTRRDARARLALTAAADDKTQVSVNGTFAVAPLALDAEASVARLPLEGLAPYVREALAASLAGRVEAKARLRIDEGVGGGAPRIESGRVVVAALRIAGLRGNDALLQVPKLEAAGIGADVHARTAIVERISASGALLQGARLRDGSVDWQRLFPSRPASPPAAEGAAWQARVAQFDLTAARARVTDLAVDPPVSLALDAVDVNLRDISTDASARVSVIARARLGGGALRASGWVRPAPLATALKVTVDNVDVTAARAYAAPHVSAILASAAITADGAVAFNAGGRTPGLRYDGEVRVTNFSALNPDGASELARWQALALSGLKIDTEAEPPSIEIGSIGLNDFYARAILSAQGKLNLIEALRPAAKADGTSAPGENAAAEAAAPAAAAGAAETAMRVRIGGIELLRGNVNFTDNFVKPNYTANLTDLAGTVGAVSSASAEMAEVSIGGKVNGDAPVQIGGKLNPLASELALDLRGSAKGVELPRLTPYSVKYAGYPITKGKLSVDVEYVVQQGKLTAQNHVFLDQLTFGERVDSPTATKLPVLFAVALLKDGNGQIDINLPISGSLNDPEFSIGGIIVRVIVNLITKAVTAPFALLGAVFGGSADLGHLAFTPGTAVMADGEAKKLETMAKALNDRPALKLEITGRALASVDSEPLRRELFERKLRAAKVRELVRAGKSVDSATVTVADDERERLIGAVYADEEIPNKPRNFLGIAKTIPAADMQKLILATIEVGEPDLRRLANDRAASVRDALQTRGNVPSERIFLVAPSLEAGSGDAAKLPPARVDFSLK